MEEPKRILYVSPFDEPLSGADESLVLAVGALNRSKFLPIVLVPAGSHYIERYERAGAEVISWPLSRLRRNYSPFYWLNYIAQLLRELSELPKLFQSKRIDLVHLNMHVSLGPLLAARRMGLPTVVHYRAKTSDRPRIFFDIYIPWLHRRSNAILCISDAVRQHFISRGLKRGVQLLRNPIPVERYFKESNHAYFELFPRFKEKKVVLFVGRIHPQKRIDVLLRAAEKIGRKSWDIGLAIVGEGSHENEDLSYERSLRSKTSNHRYPIPVEWIPRQQNVAPIMVSADLFVLPSVNEGFGRVVVEAMASGLPVVVANSGALPELVGPNQEYGQLFETDNVDDLAEAIDRAFQDPIWKTRAANAREFVAKKFTVEEHVNSLMEIYDQLLR